MGKTWRKNGSRIVQSFTPVAVHAPGIASLLLSGRHAIVSAMASAIAPVLDAVLDAVHAPLVASTRAPNVHRPSSANGLWPNKLQAAVEAWAGKRPDAVPDR